MIDSFPGCRVCFGPRREEINELLIQQRSMLSIERQMKADGFLIKRETVHKHLRVCLHNDLRNIEAPAEVAAAQERLSASLTPAQRGDFAILVHDRAVRDLVSGRLRVSTKDGLMARSLLDRREEKAEERSFQLNLARLLTGAGVQGPMALTEGAIEGEFRDVTPSPLLAPAELRE